MAEPDLIPIADVAKMPDAIRYNLHVLEKRDYRVMIITNNDEPITVGTLVGFAKFAHNYHNVVRCDDGSLLYGGMIVPYWEELKVMLESISGYDRFWGLVETIHGHSGVRRIIDDLRAADKE